ncbi:UNVERIFIED_CONTAM: Phosphoinositide phospholipase C 2 [Sesamum angustifolium]|uniref:Phosphoinositide phospholipase C n=1 Tax=Sesamum angustifolium TaxID=2727405 RepID=A0AAW2PUV6_9LAMI
MAAAEPPADVKAIFNDYSENGTMSVDHLRQFMVEVQGEEKATIEDAQEVLDSLQHLNIFHKRGLNLEAFFKYLFGDTNPPLNPKLGVHHDMNAPLSHYFIYTGHNSYLTGNQLSSDCSDVPIINALKNGVRVIELDIWPNSTKDSINVLHGRTLTAPVEFLKCLKSIKEHAFVASEYPVVITLEDHLTPELQALAAEDFDEDGEDAEYECGEDVAAEYRRLIAIHAGKGKGAVGERVKVDPDKVRRLSLSEQQIEKGVATHAFEIVRFTHKNLLRVYPKGTRVDSSNFDPLTAWMHGAQLVAFNMQGYGRELWMMQGMFKANGGCGYVKKPEFLLGHDGRVFDPKAAIPIRTTLRVTVYMGEGWYHDFNHTHFDTYSPDFYAKVGIVGVPIDSLLRIEVHEYDMSDKDDFAGQTCLPIRELRQGIRAVPLCSQKGEKYKSVKLLMRFEFL